MLFDTPLTRMLGIKYPIIQGAFGNAGTSALAVPVSEAGGLGIITSISFKTPDMFQQDLRDAKKRTDKPIAVNFTLWKGLFDNAYHEEYIKVVLKEGIETVFTSAHDGSYIGHIFKKAGCNWIHKCATIKHAVSIAGKGADAVVIVGIEGTGFKNPSQGTTLINMTAAGRLMDTPLIAAGGIADARGFMAALAMGASGIYMGTAFMATKEFQAPEKFKQKIVNQDITDPDYIRKIIHMKHGGAASLASGVITAIPTVKEFIDTMVKDAEKIMGEMNRICRQY